MRTNREVAELVAAKALAYLAEDMGRLGGFLAATGMGPAELRSEAENPEFMAGILDYMLSEEAMLVDFAERNEFDPTLVRAARHQLPGAVEDY